ncbi:uncharacterized protein LOC142351707 isoform X2 [Convolutriloba macropyga]
MKQKYPHFFTAFAWSIQLAILNIMYMVTDLLWAMFTSDTAGGQFVLIIEQFLLPAFHFALFAQAILYLGDNYFRFKNLQYQDVLSSVQSSTPLLVHDQLLTKLPKPFVRVVICWAAALVYGLLCIITNRLVHSENEHLSLIIYELSNLSVCLFLFVFIVPFLNIANNKCGSKQRELSKSLDSHMGRIKTQQRASNQTIVQFREEIRNRTAKLYSKMKEFFKIYKSTWPLMILFGLLPLTVKLCFVSIGYIGNTMEDYYLRNMYYYYQVTISGAELDEDLKKIGESYHEEYNENHALMFLIFLWPILDFLFTILLIIVTLFTNEFYQVFLRCYGRLFGYCIRKDFQRVFCKKKYKASIEPEIKITTDAWERKNAFANASTNRSKMSKTLGTATTTAESENYDSENYDTRTEKTATNTAQGN